MIFIYKLNGASQERRAYGRPLAPNYEIKPKRVVVLLLYFNLFEEKEKPPPQGLINYLPCYTYQITNTFCKKAKWYGRNESLG